MIPNAFGKGKDTTSIFHMKQALRNFVFPLTPDQFKWTKNCYNFVEKKFKIYLIRKLLEKANLIGVVQLFMSKHKLN